MVAEKPFLRCVRTSAAALYSAAGDRSSCAYSSRENRVFSCLLCPGGAGTANLPDRVVVDPCEMVFGRELELVFLQSLVLERGTAN